MTLPAHGQHHGRVRRRRYRPSLFKRIRRFWHVYRDARRLGFDLLTAWRAARKSS